MRAPDNYPAPPPTSLHHRLARRAHARAGSSGAAAAVMTAPLNLRARASQTAVELRRAMGTPGGAISAAPVLTIAQIPLPVAGAAASSSASSERMGRRGRGTDRSRRFRAGCCAHPQRVSLRRAGFRGKIVSTTTIRVKQLPQRGAALSARLGDSDLACRLTWRWRGGPNGVSLHTFPATSCSGCRPPAMKRRRTNHVFPYCRFVSRRGLAELGHGEQLFEHTGPRDGELDPRALDRATRAAHLVRTLLTKRLSTSGCARSRRPALSRNFSSRSNPPPFLSCAIAGCWPTTSRISRRRCATSKHARG